MSILIETYSLDERGRRVIPKDPDAALDYSTNWTDWLAYQGDTRANEDVYAAPGASVTVDSVIASGGVITAMISGGTPYLLEPVTFKIVTAGGRTDERTIYLNIMPR